MKVYTVEDLQAEGVPPEVVKTQSQISCFSGTFIRDRDFPKRFKDEALKIVDSYLENGINSFIVETTLFLTVWKEEKKTDNVPVNSRPTRFEDARAIAPNPTDDRTPPTTEPPAVPRRKIIRKYRGQEYEVDG